MKTSTKLNFGQVYTREELKEMFDINDATINTGIFQPKGYDSIWLFVTENKTPDRTQYEDYLDGDILEWDSQPSGRNDDKIIQHQKYGLEILLFYRKEKYEYSKAGFRYEGIFEYVKHKATQPAHFTFRRVRG